MKTIRYLSLALATTFASLAAADKPSPLSADQKAFLADYESVRAALAADDLTAANKAAAQLAKSQKTATPAAQKIASASKLDTAREAFKALSKEAVSMAKGQPGFFQANCPMVPNGEGNWVQTTRKINNPYFGKSMLTCGTIE